MLTFKLICTPSSQLPDPSLSHVTHNSIEATGDPLGKYANLALLTGHISLQDHEIRLKGKITEYETVCLGVAVVKA